MPNPNDPDVRDYYGPDGDYWADQEPEREPDPVPCENRSCASTKSGHRAYFDGRPPAYVGPEAGFWPPIGVCVECYELLTGQKFEEREEPETDLLVGPEEPPF